jgi:tetratricopeptide (TPR) repeat protein
MGEDVRTLWDSAAVKLVDWAFPDDVGTNTSTWPLCSRLMSHVVPLEAHAPRADASGKALDRLLNQACVYLDTRGDREGALAVAQRSVALKRVTRTEEPLLLAIGLCNLGGHYADLDRLEEAEAAYREALDIQEPRLDPNDPSLAMTLSNLVQVHWKRKHFEQAEPLLLRAAEIMKAAHGAESAEYGTVLSNLGALYGKWADEPGQSARRAQEETCKTRDFSICRSTRGPRHPETAISHQNLAVMKAKRANWSGAAAEAERAVAIMLSLDLAQHPDTLAMAGNLARCWERSGWSDRAARLRRSDISDLLPVIKQTEAEHRAWVAEDPKTRHFGPPPPNYNTLD